MSVSRIQVMILGNNTQVQRMFMNAGYSVLTDSDKTRTPDIVCFAGGADVNPALYGEKKHHTTVYDINRDRREEAFFDTYIDTPKVGICRGGQFLNVKSGGALWQDVSGHGLREGHNMVDLLFTKKKLFVTSTHHQMMIPSSAATVLAVAFEAKEFKTMSTRNTPEFDTEVCWYPHTQSLCYQPHPEHWLAANKNKDNEDYFFQLLDYFFE